MMTEEDEVKLRRESFAKYKKKPFNHNLSCQDKFMNWISSWIYRKK